MACKTMKPIALIFAGGCNDNLQTVPKLVDGSTIKKIGAELGGTLFDRRPTSCADRSSKAVQKARAASKRAKEESL